MSILKVLTPSEIAEYAVTNNSTRKVSKAMAAGAEDMEFGEPNLSSENPLNRGSGEAQIIPLHGRQKDEEEEENDHFHEVVKERANPEESSRQPRLRKEGLESLGIYSADHVQKLEAEIKKKENASKDSATVFLLKQRERLKDSKTKLIGQTAIKSYKQVASKEFHEQEIDLDSEDQDFSNDSKGILVNKKYY